MRKELQEKLEKKWPKLFGQKNMSEFQSCMHYGLEIGDGWYDLFDVMCGSIQDYVNQKQASDPKFLQPELAQVKEENAKIRAETDARIAEMQAKFDSQMATLLAAVKEKTPKTRKPKVESEA